MSVVLEVSAGRLLASRKGSSPAGLGGVSRETKHGVRICALKKTLAGWENGID